jgi:hypothetical protein
MRYCLAGYCTKQPNECVRVWWTGRGWTTERFDAKSYARSHHATQALHRMNRVKQDLDNYVTDIEVDNYRCTGVVL